MTQITNIKNIGDVNNIRNQTSGGNAPIVNTRGIGAAEATLIAGGVSSRTGGASINSEGFLNFLKAQNIGINSFKDAFTKLTMETLNKFKFQYEQFSSSSSSSGPFAGKTYGGFRGPKAQAGTFEDLFGKIGAGGIGGGIDKALGGITSFIEPFKAAWLELFVVFELAKKALELFAEGVRHGAETYRGAAKIGEHVDEWFQVASAFKTIGLEGGEAAILRGQFSSKGRRFGLPGQEGEDVKTLLGAAKASGYGDIQQLQNMSKDFEAAMKDAASSARQMELSSRTSQQLTAETSAISREWHTLLTQLSTLVGPIIGGLEIILKEILKTFNEIIEVLIRGLNWIMQRIFGRDWIDHGDNFKKTLGRQGGLNETVTGFERMGFIFGGKNGTLNEDIKQTANNTKESVDWLKTIASAIINGGPSGPGPYVPITFFP